MHKALYRQYRPKIFDDVYGQDVIVKTLKNSITNHSFGHAYIFFGPRGTGKTSVAKIFARSLNCLNSKAGNACGECLACQNSYNNECLDIIEIDAASNNGVDEIRELKNKVSLVPSVLKYKVYIIDEVHMLSIGAFNALLKTLEEPPEHAVFILATTDPQKVPETIISRCQCFSFKRISVENIESNLDTICKKEKIDIDIDVLNEIACVAAGGMRDALSLLDQLRSFSNEKITLKEFADVNGTLTNQELEEFYNAIFNSEFSVVLTLIKKYNDLGKNVVLIIEKLMRMARDKIVNFYLKKEKTAYPLENINKFVLLINDELNNIKKSSSPIIYIEMLLLNFMNNIKMDLQPFKSEETMDNTSKTLSIDLKNYHNINKSAATKQKNGSNESYKNDENKSIEEKENENEKIIVNLPEILSVRINNTLAKADKKLLLDEIDKLKLFNDYTFDSNFGYIACIILDSKIRAVSDENIIISYEYDSVVKQNLSEIDKIIDVYNRITSSNKKIAIVSDKDWDKIKSQYISDIKNGVTYEVKKEPEEHFLENKKSDIINETAIKLFGDIVEID